ncbi:hypothetical protein [Euzebya tangerina]|uniref:hypothetical protein n=1 Tax=Euzebya tangerina TaxID=591198 RepID=UPI0013C2D55E|nr:hypothetical protein [Euzebya tangerina]
MSQGPSGDRGIRDTVDDNPLQGGLTGIALVAAAMLLVAALAAAICGAALLLIG